MLVTAGLFEVAMAYSLKLSDGFSVPLPSIGFVVSAGLSFGLLALTLKSLMSARPMPSGRASVPSAPPHWA
jgi:quaternary ammonium compound-resistance protein SugE